MIAHTSNFFLTFFFTSVDQLFSVHTIDLTKELNDISQTLKPFSCEFKFCLETPNLPNPLSKISISFRPLHPLTCLYNTKKKKILLLPLLHEAQQWSLCQDICVSCHLEFHIVEEVSEVDQLDEANTSAAAGK